MKNQVSRKVVDLLKKEIVFTDFALKRLKREMVPFEKNHSLKWEEFLSKFEKGELGDRRVWFKWYALARSTLDWYDTKKEIKKALGNS